MTNTCLGIDLGTNSIGWALFATDGHGEARSLIDSGVRIFTEAVDAKSRVPKNQARRQKRQLRRQLMRRRRRMEAVRNVLMQTALLPAEVGTAPDQEGLWNRLGDPWQLRAEGLDRALAPHELGRAFLHLARHRGFLSNRKAARKADEDGTTTDAGINLLSQTIAAAGNRTLGEYLSKQPVQRNRDDQRPYYTSRAMLLAEFEALWKAQAPHHSVLDDALLVRLHRAIFHQRPLKSQAHTIGVCQLETSVGRSRPRAAWAWPVAQRFRILEQVARLRLIHPHRAEAQPLSVAERQALIQTLTGVAKLTWDKARKAVGKVRGTTLGKQELFNLEQGGLEHLIGDRTGTSIRGILEDEWDGFDAAKRHALVEDLLTIDHEDGLLRRLQEHWSFDRQTAVALGKLRLEEKPGRLSLKAIRNLLPHLEAGLDYDGACQAAGYLRRDQQVRGQAARLDAPPNLRNPVVMKALNEVRKVVNGIVRTHGQPSVIRVEMARDLKMSPKDKEAFEKAQKQNAKVNAFADDFWQQLGVRASHDDRVKFRLWRDQGEVCPYTQHTISAAMLASDAVQVDHILPFSRTLDDSYGNKVLCLTQANAEKGNRTPWEWLGGQGTRFENMLVLAEKMDIAPGKRRRFAMTADEFALAYGGERDFVARQLNDTRWICRAVKDYLGSLAGVTVEVTKGEATAALRHQWALNPLLSDSMEKNRADHRHHAVDAAVIACTGRAVFQRIAAAAHKARGDGWRNRIVDPPWEGFRAAVRDRLATIVVSHAVDRRISGGFHEDTAYGVAKEVDGRLELVYRKALTRLTPAMLAKIRDPVVQELVIARLRAEGLDPDAFAPKDAALVFGNPKQPVLHKDGATPIRSVRILKPNVDARGVMRRGGRTAYELGNNHHVELIRNTATGKIEGCFVSALEAANRARRTQQPVINQGIGTETDYICTLHINDTVEVPNADEKRYYRVQQLSPVDGGKITLRLSTAASLEENSQRLILTPNTFIKRSIRKVSVDPLGRVNPDDQARHRDRQPGPPAP